MRLGSKELGSFLGDKKEMATLYRLLEIKLDRNNTHFTPDQILETLKNMNVVNCQDIYYQACYTGSDVLDSLEQLFHLQLDRKYYLPKTLNRYQKK